MENDKVNDFFFYSTDGGALSLEMFKDNLSFSRRELNKLGELHWTLHCDRVQSMSG
jgi:hypothetical protein